MNKIYKIVLLLFLATCSIFAQGERIGTAGATEVLIPVGGRGVAMGGAMLTNSVGVDAIFWNPANISRAIVEWFDDSLRVTRRIDAQRLTYINYVWTGITAEERRFSPSGEMSYIMHDTLSLPEIADTPEDFGSRRKSAAEMNIFQLWDHIGRVRIAGGNPTGDLVEFWLTLFFPLSSLIMVLVGAPMATNNPRSGRSTSIGLAVLLGFIFFSLARFGQTLGHKGALSPIVAAALPEVVFILLGIWLFRRAGQQ